MLAEPAEGRWPRGLRGRGLPAPKHPKGRKRRSGWDVGTGPKAGRGSWRSTWRLGLWSSWVVSAERRAGGERDLTLLRAFASWLLGCSNWVIRAEWRGVEPCGWCARTHWGCGCSDVVPEWMVIGPFNQIELDGHPEATTNEPCLEGAPMELLVQIYAIVDLRSSASRSTSQATRVGLNLFRLSPGTRRSGCLGCRPVNLHLRVDHRRLFRTSVWSGIPLVLTVWGWANVVKAPALFHVPHDRAAQTSGPFPTSGPSWSRRAGSSCCLVAGVIGLSGVECVMKELLVTSRDAHPSSSLADRRDG